MLRIHSFETFWTNEWPGIRCIVFLQGCQFRCLYCHNPDTQSMEGGKFYSVEQICEKIERVRPYFGKFWGVTISGWEPLLQAKALIPLFVELKKRWIHTTLDTNGYPWNGDVEVLVRDYTDLVLLDIKEINQERHKILTWFSNLKVLKFAHWLSEIQKPTWIRYVLVPGYTDSMEDLEEFGRQISIYKNIESVDILPYHTLGSYKYAELGIQNKLAWVSRPTQESIVSTKTIFEKYFKKVLVR
jgi:pyruvate formate lyase activating enzyme